MEEKEKLEEVNFFKVSSIVYHGQFCFSPILVHHFSSSLFLFFLHFFSLFFIFSSLFSHFFFRSWLPLRFIHSQLSCLTDWPRMVRLRFFAVNHWWWEWSKLRSNLFSSSLLLLEKVIGFSLLQPSRRKVVERFDTLVIPMIGIRSIFVHGYKS